MKTKLQFTHHSRAGANPVPITSPVLRAGCFSELDSRLRGNDEKGGGDDESRSGTDGGKIGQCLLALLIGVCLASGVQAALPLQPQPLIINSDHSLTTLDKKADTGRTIYTGHVVITRGSFVMHGAQAIVYTRNQHLEKAVVTGAAAQFTWQPDDGRTVHGRAQTITYLAGENALVLESEARLQRGEQVFSAARVHYDLDSRTVQAQGKKGQRVRVVIPPAPSTAARPEASR